MSEQNDRRGEAAERLMYVALLQLHRQRRGPAEAPWRDPTQGQGRVLALLKMKPEITQRELTFLMGMSRQSLAELLAKLERQGLVEREPSTEDRRVVVVRLTEAGQAAEQEAAQVSADPDVLLDALDDGEVAALSEYLARIIERTEREVADEVEERREAFEELWRSRGFPPDADRFGGAFPGFGGFPGYGGPGGRPGWLGAGGPWASRGRRDWGCGADDERTED